MPLNCRLGKNKLWQGAPLRAFAKWEPAPLTSSSKVKLLAQCISVELGKPGWSGEFLLDDKHETAIEVPTVDLRPGAYEIALSISDKEEHLLVPEPIWILSREQFLQLAREEAEEDFLPAPPLSRIEELRSFVEDTIGKRLRIPISVPTSRRQTGRSVISMFGPASEGLFERPISSGPIQWTTEAVSDEVNYIAIGGAKSLTFRIDITRDTFGLRFRVILNNPLSKDTLRTLKDKQLNELYLLNVKGDLKDFAVGIQAAPFSAEVSMGVKHAIEAHPVLKLSTTQDVRPAPRARIAGMSKKSDY